MQQILFLHGGNSFDSYEAYIASLKKSEVHYDRILCSQHWREWVATQLPNDDILTPTMPNGYNAQYDEWVIYFEKIVPFLRDDFTLVGHSLGAMFLAKYLHETVLPTKANKIVLVAGVYGEHAGESNGSFTVKSASGVERSCDEVHLFHSEDDPVVPYGDLEKFHRDIPSAVIHSFKTRGHFVGSTFPEMLDLLKQK